MAGRNSITSATAPWDQMVRWTVEWPVAVSGLWWAWALTAWHSHHHYSPKHHDLAVPDPIVEEGEHSLFA